MMKTTHVSLETCDEGYFLAAALFLVEHHAKVLFGRFKGNGFFFAIVEGVIGIGGVNGPVFVTLVFHEWYRF